MFPRASLIQPLVLSVGGYSDYRQVVLELMGVGVGPRLTTVGRNLCALPPASAGPRPALVAYHPLLLQGIQGRSTLPPHQRSSRALQLLRFCTVDPCNYSVLV